MLEQRTQVKEQNWYFYTLNNLFKQLDCEPSFLVLLKNESAFHRKQNLS